MGHHVLRRRRGCHHSIVKVIGEVTNYMYSRVRPGHFKEVTGLALQRADSRRPGAPHKSPACAGCGG
jgi:hypothetical protein